ncbi:mucin-5B-like [Ambystoma mexicanum]|uniref:mucin-5B-like n=1 Tax=Ambystoma mexicanum TaxID=8296 RepID=UPI0037E9404B
MPLYIPIEQLTSQSFVDMEVALHFGTITRDIITSPEPNDTLKIIDTNTVLNTVFMCFVADIHLTSLQFGNLQKLDGPTEQCENPSPEAHNNCTHLEHICASIWSDPAFDSCQGLVGIKPYIEACTQDLCQGVGDVSFCLCATVTEYSRQCTHAGGRPKNWRRPDLCFKQCPATMQYKECGSPCQNACSNRERTQLCEQHCMHGCFCPAGTILDDIDNRGCIPHDQCSCTYNGDTYHPGMSYTTPCRSCTCVGGRWNCVDIPCSGMCFIEGGSHITTYDDNRYRFHGDCTYVLSKSCSDNTFTVLGELRKCGLTDSETCLKGVQLQLLGGQTVIVIKPDGSVFMNSIHTRPPISAANVTIIQPSSLFIIVHLNLGLQLHVQLKPIMQLSIILDQSFRGNTCGLCGNFNNVQVDDFTAVSGVLEGSSAAFGNTWKTTADCPNVKNIYEHPCALSIENEKYAQHWCALLTDPNGVFSECHGVLNPALYHMNCMFDTCNCEKSEDCLCAALSSYVRGCAFRGVMLTDWRVDICNKYTSNCPESQTYRYIISSSQATCRSRSERDITSSIKFVPVDGCTCQDGALMDDTGKCVPLGSCPCYYKMSAMPSGEVIRESGIMCTCTQGKLSCIGEHNREPECFAPMIYFDCAKATVGTRGSACQKSCQTLDMECYSTQCISGCVCPHGLVSDGRGNCIHEDNCPCMHNEEPYQSGDKIQVNCNTCTCKNRMWHCTKKVCLGTCIVYGDGHYVTFDGKRYNFNGDCEYTLAQDHCGSDGNNGTFRVITENIPCGSAGTTCSKALKIFMLGYEMKLSDRHFDVVQRGIGQDVPYKIRHMGIYMVIENNDGLVVIWDMTNSIIIKLSPSFKGRICGLCGNYDGNSKNDFATRSHAVVGDVTEFANSWKFSTTCPDVGYANDPCSVNPYRRSWAQKQCSIITSKAFTACHAQIGCSLQDLNDLGITYTNYTDNTKIILPILANYDADSHALSKIYQTIQTWMAQNRLRLNDEKTELLIGTQSRLNKLNDSYKFCIIDGNIFTVAKEIKTLGVYLHSELSLKRQ